MLKHLDLFSGIGGWTLGFHATEEIETVGFCEIEKYPQQILKQHYPGTPIFEDVRKLDYEQLRTAGLISDTQRIDILTCSYPCQPFSVAGKKRGEEDPRHLWPEVHRLIRDDRIRPMYVLGENVGGHIRLGIDTVSEDMERCGYRWRCFSIEAACVGANHKRQRVWWIAEDMEYTNSNECRTSKPSIDTNEQESNEGRSEQLQSRVSRSSKTVADTNDNGHEGGLFETRDQDVTGQDTQSIRRTNTKDVIRQSNDGGDNQEARANGAVSKSSDDGKTESTRTTRVRGVFEESNDHQGTNGKDTTKEDNNRALVQKGQEGVQPSIDRGLGSDQTTLKGTEIRQGTDNDGIYRVAESKDVADTKRKPKHNQSNSRSDFESQEEKQETRPTDGSGSGQDVANTNRRRHRGGRTIKTSGKDKEWGLHIEKKEQTTDDLRSKTFRRNTVRGETKNGSFTRNWDVEPNVGRVANGVPNRVHRLKALGNAIVPQMAYYIGQALLKDFQHKNHN